MKPGSEGAGVGRTEQFARWNARRQGKVPVDKQRRSAERALSGCGQPSLCGARAGKSPLCSHTQRGAGGGEGGYPLQWPLCTFPRPDICTPRVCIPFVCACVGKGRRPVTQSPAGGRAGVALLDLSCLPLPAPAPRRKAISRTPSATLKHIPSLSHTHRHSKKGKWVCPAPDKGLVFMSFLSISKGVVSVREGIRRKLENNQRSSGQRSCANAALGSMNLQGLWLVVPSRMNSCCSLERAGRAAGLRCLGPSVSASRIPRSPSD